VEDVDYYLQKARECLKRLKTTDDPQKRESLLALAREFLLAAEEAERASEKRDPPRDPSK
jgi:hypothetical protein